MLALVAFLSAVIGASDGLGPPRIIGALVVDRDPATITTGLIIAGVFAHFVLSVLFTYILALFIHRMGTMTAVAAGAAYGIVLYLVNFYVMAVAFPWFADFRNGSNLVSHLVFGMAAAWVYKRLRAPKARPVHEAPAARTTAVDPSIPR